MKDKTMKKIVEKRGLREGKTVDSSSIRQASSPSTILLHQR